MTRDRQRMNQVSACLRRRGRNPVRRYLDRVDPDLIQIDPDSFTQKLLQTIWRNPLIYRVILRQGRDHDGVWRVSRVVSGRFGSVGRNSDGDVVNHDGYVANHVVNLSGKELGKELGKKTEVGEKTSELVEKTSEVGEKESVDKSKFEILMGLSENSVGRAIRAMKDVGLLVREGGDKGGRWIVKRGFKA